ncbi:bacteriohemerythrin [Novispirillum sp. DQ9]|uniref:bacteriohemerythrin n=1 Tax=Novispirillum sp. DQ9 TaxID=3398612 RepID=UPI003C7EC290
MTTVHAPAAPIDLSVRVAGSTMTGSLRIFEGHHRGVGAHIERIGLAIEALRVPAGRRPEPAQVNRLLCGLADLRSFAEVHFAHEEKLMEDVQYPQRARHAGRHRAFLSWMDRLETVSRESPQRLFASGPATVLAGWWEAHAHGQDRALTEFLCRGGI